MFLTTQGALDQAVVAAVLQAMAASVRTKVSAGPPVTAAAAARNTYITAAVRTPDTPANGAAAVNLFSHHHITACSLFALTKLMT